MVDKMVDKMMAIAHTYGTLIKHYYVEVIFITDEYYSKTIWIEVKNKEAQRRLCKLLGVLKE